MTIAEAGPVGRIKHNFSVMVRGVGFSTLIISSASQSRPLSRLLFPRARSSPSFGFATGTPSLLGIHFHAFSWATRPPLPPARSSSAELPPSAFYPIRQLSSPSPILSPSLFLCFFYLLSRALITNFSLFSRNSRSSEQLFRADSGGFSSACSSPSHPLLSSPFATPLRSFFFSLSKTRVSAHRRYIEQSVFGTCSFRLRNANIHSRAEDREIL